MLWIRAGLVIPAGGLPPLTDGAVLIRNGKVAGVISQHEMPREPGVPVLDRSDCVVAPGFINIHTHGVSPQPLFPSGAGALPESIWLGNLDRHLLAGSTTVLSTCGLGGMDEIHFANRVHPIRVSAATTHTPSAVAAATAADGAGLNSHHRRLTVESMLEAGAVAVGELGGGQTLGGGGQDLVYIPAAIHDAFGVEVDQSLARRMKEAVLGRDIVRAANSTAQLKSVVLGSALENVSVTQLERLIIETVEPSVALARVAIREGVAEAQRLGAPSLIHSASATAGLLRDLMNVYRFPEAPIIAGHVNHTSHTVEEAVDLARAGSEAGWYAECSVFDLLHRQHTVTTRDHWDAVLRDERWVQMISTDYGHNGLHDSLADAVADLVASGLRSLAEAIEMVTSTPARLIPGIVEGTATLRAGEPADIVVLESADLRSVREVFIAGTTVVSEGKRTG